MSESSRHPPGARAPEPVAFGHWPAALLLIALLLCAWQVSRTTIVTDLSAFMPKLPTARQQMLADQLRDGIVARLMMVGIEGGDAAARADASRALATGLRASGAFMAVQNGDDASRDADQAFFFKQRYLLSPAVDAQRFSAAGLRSAIEQSLDALTGSGGMALARLLPRDPTGEAVALLEQTGGLSEPNRADGVWASADGARAVMVLQTRAGGSDLDGQAQAIDTLRATFAKLPNRQPQMRLLVSGAGAMAVASRHAVQSDIHRLAMLGLGMVVLLLLAVYRSPRLLLLSIVPIVSGALAGVAAVSAVFGHVHGLTLAFGTTLIGEAVDYAIYLFVQRAAGQPSRHFWRVIGLGVLASLVGFASLIASSFPGLAQLGLYSVTGLAVAALVTRFVLPSLASGKASAAVGAGPTLRRWLLRGESVLRRLPWLPLLAAALGALAIARAPQVWNDQLSGLNPATRAAQELEVRLRDDLGAPALRHVASITAGDEQTALRQAERAQPVLQALTQAGVIAGFNSPALVWPSRTVQAARRAALPEAAVLRERLRAALDGLPLSANKLESFIDDVAAARSGPLIARDDLRDTSASVVLDSLLVRRAHDVLLLLPLRSAREDGAIDVAAVQAQLRNAGIAGAVVIDTLAETSSIFRHYLDEALTLSLAGAAGVALVLALALRDLRRLARVLLPVGCAGLTVAGGLVFCGHTLTILHLVGLLLVVALGSNYALFFSSRRDEDGTAWGDSAAASHPQMLLSLLVANLTTVGSFGLLATSQVSVLAAIGMTVAPGAWLALFFSAALAGGASRSAHREQP